MKKKCKHEWYFSDAVFKDGEMVRAEQTCEKCARKRWVKVEKYK